MEAEDSRCVHALVFDQLSMVDNFAHYLAIFASPYKISLTPAPAHVIGLLPACQFLFLSIRVPVQVTSLLTNRFTPT